MSEANEVREQELSSPASRASTSKPWRPGLFALAVGTLIACFALPLYDLLKFSLGSTLYSHVVLIPAISLYLVWIKRRDLAPAPASKHWIAGSFLAAGGLLLAGYWIGSRSGAPLARDDSLALTTFAFLLFFFGICGWFLDRRTLRDLLFPLGFLLFLVPFPNQVRSGMETFLQHGSAAAAQVLFKLSGTTVFSQDLIFKLPGISLEVAPECSGIRSSLALFITSLLAGHFFLRTPWKCAALTLVVIPLAILRNGVRIFTVGELCVHLGPQMINSYIHRQGGPVFFLLSLVPFVFFLRLLVKSDRLAKNGLATASRA